MFKSVVFTIAAFIVVAASYSVVLAQSKATHHDRSSFLSDKLRSQPPHLWHIVAQDPDRIIRRENKIDEAEFFNPSNNLSRDYAFQHHPESPIPTMDRTSGTRHSGIHTYIDTLLEEWVKNYGSGLSPAKDAALAMVIDAFGNVYVTGRSSGSGTDYDYATIKYNSSGAEQWIARYNGPGNSYDGARAIAVDASGNVYVTGLSTGSGTDYDYATLKYNSSGVEQWVARYNGPVNSYDGASAIAVDAAGNVYVTGYSVGSGTSPHYCTIKYNSSGVEQWVARYNGPDNSFDIANAIAVDALGNVWVTGVSIGSGTLADYATIKYNSSGVQQWVARYNGPGNSDDVAFAIAVDAASNVYVAGRSSGSGTYFDYATIKYSSSGVEQWVARRYNGPGNLDDIANAIAVDAAGNVYVTGESYGSGTSRDYATIKYSSSGVQQWVARYNGLSNSDDCANAIAVDQAGNVYVTGESEGSGTYFDFATIKYSSAGVEQWVARYNGPGNFDDYATAIAVDASGNVYVTGYSQGSGWSVYTTIKYRQQPVSVEELPVMPTEYSLSQNYPNPFNPTTKIKFSLPRSEFVSLRVFNSLGEELAVLLSEHISAGVYQVDWNAKDLPSGIYFYQLNSGSYVETKKMILIK